MELNKISWSKLDVDKESTPRNDQNKIKPLKPNWKEEFGDESEIKEVVEPPLHLPAPESALLEATANGDERVARVLLNAHPEIDVNCVDSQGIAPIQLAVLSRSEPLVALLLERGADVLDSALLAARDNLISIVVLILNHLRRHSPALEFCGVSRSSHFPPYTTPLGLAARTGHRTLVRLLLARGHRVPRPHAAQCHCHECSSPDHDELQSSLSRLSGYAALSSAALLATARDPLSAALRLTRELDEASSHVRHLSPAYERLRSELVAFLLDVVGCCHTSEEVKLLLKTGASPSRHSFEFPRLLMAMDCKQKEFVAHPNTQTVLETYWIGTWKKWCTMSLSWKLFHVSTRVFVTPSIFLFAILLPQHKLLRHWSIPINKMITHFSAYVLFLVFVFLQSNQEKTKQKRGPPQTGLEGILVLYVCGYAWSAARMCAMQGPRRYCRAVFNWSEIIMLLLFAVTFTLWALAIADVAAHDKKDLERKYWNQFDPTLLAEGTFCAATILAFIRLLFLCQVNYSLGSLQVSLGKMTIDIFKYLFVYGIIMMAFAAGLARLYQYYDGMVYEDEAGMKTAQVSSFTSFSDTLKTLFWALFCLTPVESADVIIENPTPPPGVNASAPPPNLHNFTEQVGYIAFAFFEIIAVIMVLNMLIATMSNTFHRINDNVDIEWTFSKTKIYVDYIMQTTLPPPYNLVPTVVGVQHALQWLRARCHPSPALRARWLLDFCCYMEHDIDEQLQSEYALLVQELLHRYFRQKEAADPTTRLESEIDKLRREVNSLRSVLKLNETKLRLDQA